MAAKQAAASAAATAVAAAAAQVGVTFSLSVIFAAKLSVCRWERRTNGLQRRNTFPDEPPEPACLPVVRLCGCMRFAVGKLPSVRPSTPLLHYFFSSSSPFSSSSSFSKVAAEATSLRVVFAAGIILRVTTSLVPGCRSDANWKCFNTFCRGGTVPILTLLLLGCCSERTIDGV